MESHRIFLALSQPAPLEKGQTSTGASPGLLAHRSPHVVRIIATDDTPLWEHRATCSAAGNGAEHGLALLLPWGFYVACSSALGYFSALPLKGIEKLELRFP